jgi:hypothetical protein
MNFNQSHDPSDALGEEPRRVSDVLSQSVIYSKIVQHRLLLSFDTQNTGLIRLVCISVTLDVITSDVNCRIIIHT